MPWMNPYHMNFNNIPSFPGGFFSLPVLLPALMWSLVWKGLALYRAARNGQKIWFAVLLLVNTMGILEIVYLLIFADGKKGFTKLSAKTKRK